MSENQTPLDVLPDELTAARISDTRREALQLINDRPGKIQRWYTERLEVSGSYLDQLKHHFPDVFDNYRDEEFGSLGGQRWYLDSEIRNALIEDGVIDADEVSDLENTAEEPSQKLEKGNVSVEGVFDATDGVGAPQTFSDLPHDPHAGGDGTDEASAEAESDGGERAVESDSDAAHPETPTVYFFNLSEEDVVDIIRQTDRSTAEEVFRQAVQVEHFPDGGE